MLGKGGSDAEREPYWWLLIMMGREVFTYEGVDMDMIRGSTTGDTRVAVVVLKAVLLVSLTVDDDGVIMLALLFCIL